MAFQAIDEVPRKFPLFNLKQRFMVGSETIPFGFRLRTSSSAPASRPPMAVPNPKIFKAGEDIIRIKVISGDHLFVDRVTYNFRRPNLGEIIVFETRGIRIACRRTSFISNAWWLWAEGANIGDDRHMVLDGKRLDNKTPHFENVYSFDPTQPPRNSVYSGHLNQKVADDFGMPNLARYFRTETNQFLIGNESLYGNGRQHREQLGFTVPGEISHGKT